MASKITSDVTKWQVHDFLAKIGTKSLNLRPDFQRFYIWDKEKERGFIDSLLRQYTVPPLWLWGHTDADGDTTYDVIDGQQRLTCIQRFVSNQFSFAPVSQSPSAPGVSDLPISYFDKVPAGDKSAATFDKTTQSLVKNYWMPFVLVETDDRGAVIDIFRRLNKSSTNLTPQELRNAFFSGHFKKAVYDLTDQLQRDAYWGHKDRVFAPDRTDRMGSQQYVSDLIVALMEQSPQHQSEKLDDFYETYDSSFIRQKATVSSFKANLSIIKKARPSQSRFTQNRADFYTLFLLVDDLTRNKAKWSEANVASLRESLQLFEKNYVEYLEVRTKDPEAFPMMERYRETIVGRQRELEVRQERARILKGLIEPALVAPAATDPVRVFSTEQRQYIWNRAADKACCRCGLAVDEPEYEPDHFPIAWKNGGRTSITNGAVSHRSCNQSAGARNDPAI